MTTDSHKTGRQLRTETIAAMNAAIAASGIPDGWGSGAEVPVPWNPDTVEFSGDLCTTVPGHDGLLFAVDLFHAPVGDPVAFARKMGDYWKAQGYTVTAVGGETDLGKDHYSELRADRADGTLYAGVASSAVIFNIGIYSECSTDPTLEMWAGPNGYRVNDPTEVNPYHPTNTPTVVPYPRTDRAAAMGRMRLNRHVPALLAILTTTLLLGGCTMTTDSRKTGQQLRTEIAATNAAIAATGIPDGWGSPAEVPVPWNPDTVEFSGEQCTTVPGHVGRRFEVDLSHTPVGDPLALTHKMMDYWEAQGYTVTPVGGIDIDEATHTSDFRVDRPDGTLYGGLTTSTEQFSIDVISECSTDPTLEMWAGPNGYRVNDPTEVNPSQPTNSPTVIPYPKD